MPLSHDQPVIEPAPPPVLLHQHQGMMPTYEPERHALATSLLYEPSGFRVLHETFLRLQLDSLIGYIKQWLNRHGGAAHGLERDQGIVRFVRAIADREINERRRPSKQGYHDAIDNALQQRYELPERHRQFILTHLDELRQQWNKRATKANEIPDDRQMKSALAAATCEQVRLGNEPTPGAYRTAIDNAWEH